jgi:hypothetical protein
MAVNRYYVQLDRHPAWGADSERFAQTRLQAEASKAVAEREYRDRYREANNAA